MDDPCIFCQIVAGDIPCHKLYEDARVLAFLDIEPLSRGHMLVIPKHHAVTLDRLPDEDAAAIGAVLPQLVRAVKSATGIEACNVLQNNGKPAGQLVMHVHFHIIPKLADAHNSGLGIGWPAGKLGGDDAKVLIEQITAALV